MTTTTALTDTTDDIAARIPPKSRQLWRTLVGISALLLFTIATTIPAIGGINIDLASIVHNWHNGYSKMLQMLQPNFDFLPRTWRPMVETLQMALVGAAASAVVSISLTLWAAKPTNPDGLTRSIVRTMINVIRAVPDLVYATVLVAMVGVGALPGVLTLFLFNIGIVVKLVSEAIDSADHSYMEAGPPGGGPPNKKQPIRAIAP
ncbi:MAG: ABC transporter permease subunit, partial [Yaniella sp.]|nr:ABC transporter permease subunit [Yaniella sp.]